MFSLVERKSHIEAKGAEKCEIAQSATYLFEPFRMEIGKLGEGDSAKIGEGNDADRLCDLHARLGRGENSRSPSKRLIVFIQWAYGFISVAAQIIFGSSEK